MILRLIRSGLRRVLNLSFMAILSVLLFIGLGCLWERSMRIADSLYNDRPSGARLCLSTTPRKLEFFVEIPWGDVTVKRIGWLFESEDLNQHAIDFYLTKKSGSMWPYVNVTNKKYGPPGGGCLTVEARIPLWFPMVLTLIAPLCWLRRGMRQARRVSLGLCLHCGYDLRSTPDATSPRLARCPECGREPGREGRR